ncbi:hypothetical protein ACFWCB_05895 [Streptomyces sp. NPDC060048]|uniref:hypothetical protein n=1 Tax=unclassified Streptomyces TaxID=2593676 RepID=UPI0036C7D779
MASLFPHNLIRLQYEWIRTYEALTRLTPVQSSTDLRRRLIELSRALASHPYWGTAGCSPARHTELVRRARAYGWEAVA